MAAAGQFRCPPAGSYLAVYGQFLVAAVTLASVPLDIHAGHRVQGTRAHAALRVFAARQGMGLFYGRGGSCWSAHVLPSGSLKVTNEPHG